MTVFSVSDELIWHFVAYLHQAEQLSKWGTTYNAVYGPEGRNEPYVVAAQPVIEFDTETVKDNTSRPTEHPDHFGYTWSTLSPLAVVQPPSASNGSIGPDDTPASNFVSPKPVIGPPEFGGDGGAGAFGIPPIVQNIQLSIGDIYGDTTESIVIDQRTKLVDNDSLTGGIPAGGPTQAEIEAELEELITLAEEQGEGEQVTLEPTETEGVTAIRFVNGEQVPLETDEGEDGGGAETEEPADETDIGDIIEFGVQDITTGSNEQSNIAQVRTTPGTGPSFGEVEVEQDSDLDDSDLVDDPVLENAGTATQFTNLEEAAPEQETQPPDFAAPEGVPDDQEGGSEDPEADETDEETEADPSVARLLTQDIDTGGNSQSNEADISVPGGNGPSSGTDLDVGQSNDLDDDDVIDNPEVRNLGSATQTVTATDGTVDTGEEAAAAPDPEEPEETDPEQRIANAPDDDTDGDGTAPEGPEPGLGPEAAQVQSAETGDDIPDTPEEPSGPETQSEEHESQATANAVASGELLTQDIDTGGNSQKNAVSVDTESGPGEIGIGGEIEQTNELNDEDELEDAQLINAGDVQQVVSATGGSAGSGQPDPVGPQPAAAVELAADPELVETVPEPGLSAELGGNEVTNDAKIVDFGLGNGSMIVEGDVHLSTMIHQSIVLVDNDTVVVEGTGGVATATSGPENSAVNDAEFINDSRPLADGTVYGTVLSSVGWNIDYVMGDYVDETTIFQQSIVYDNDVSVQTAYETESNVVLGGNVIENVSLTYEYASSYDLVIVGGNYYEDISIYQSAVLFDSDYLTVTVDPDGGPGSTSISTNGNEITNDASVMSFGDDDYDDLNGNEDVVDLVERVETQDTEGPFELSYWFDFQANGSDAIDVLYIAGDYSHILSIEQQIVVADVDVGLQYVGADEAENAAEEEADQFDTFEDDPFQDLSSGGNTLTNFAMVIDADDITGGKFTGGNVYQDHVLVQAEFVADVDIGDELGPEPGSLIAGLNGGVDTDGGGLLDEGPAPSSSSGTSHGDVLGSVIA